jgi:geranylgeranyl diphosphate synthase type II
VQSVESIHARKTAALIGASVTSGAILAGATGPVVEDLRNYGLRVGAVFQISDDLLDADRGEECSLLRVYTPGQARARAEELLDEALGMIEGFGEAAQPLRTLAVFALRRNR